MECSRGPRHAPGWQMAKGHRFMRLPDARGCLILYIFPRVYHLRGGFMKNALLLFLLIAGLGLEAKDNRQQWKEYTFEDDGFIVSLPATVTPHKDSQDSNFNVYPIPLGIKSFFNLRTAAQSIDCGVFMRDLRQKLQDSMAPGYHPPIPGSFKQVSI